MALTDLIFDFDGTIIDSFEESIAAYNRAARLMRTNIVNPEDHDEVRMQTPRQLMRKGNITKRKLPFVVFLSRYYFKKRATDFKLIDGIDEVLLELSNNYNLHILTSNTQKVLKRFTNIHPHLDIFETMDTESNLFGKDKALERFVKKRSLSKENILYVGDEIRDIQACKRANVKIISVGWGFNHPSVLLERNENTITHPSALLDLVSREFE